MRRFLPALLACDRALLQIQISPIICEGDVIGSVILVETDHKSKMGEVEQKLIQSAAGFLGRQMEQ